jgi:hypothetical protein
MIAVMEIRRRIVPPQAYNKENPGNAEETPL